MNFGKLVEQISVLGKIPEHEVTKPSMLHLTLLMLNFTDNKEKLEKATQLLHKLRNQLF